MKVKLSERQWDAILLALEDAAGHCAALADKNRKMCHSHVGIQRASWRYTETAFEIVRQLKWESTPQKKGLWTMEVKEPDLDEKDQTP